MPAFSSAGALIIMPYTMGAPHMWLTLCSLIRPKIRAGSILRRQTLVPALAAMVQGKHQPLQWNIGSVQR